MRFSWYFFQNMLENGHFNLQTNLWVHITSNIFKISNSKITGSHQPPDLPTLKAYPTPGVGGRFGIFSLKWRERMNLKVPRAILPLGCANLSTRARTVRGVGTTPLRRTRVNGWYLFWYQWKEDVHTYTVFALNLQPVPSFDVKLSQFPVTAGDFLLTFSCYFRGW